jgi:hypothetical protein
MATQLNADDIRFRQAEIRKAQSYEYEALTGESDKRTTHLVIQGLKCHYNELASEGSGAQNFAVRQAEIRGTLDDYERRLREEDIGKSSDELLESFICRITRIVDDTAYIAFTDRQGHHAVAEYDARELTGYGLSESSLFRLNFNRRGKETVAIIEPIHPRKLSADEVKAIRDRIDSLLGDYDPRQDI